MIFLMDWVTILMPGDQCGVWVLGGVLFQQGVGMSLILSY
jgi:hypothetical protein